MSAASCPHGDESFIVADYLAGRLSEAEVYAFEEHSFGCDRCFEELQRAAELRVTGSGEQTAPADGERSAAAAPSRRGTGVWPALALAATVVLAVGLWFARPSDDAADPIYRDAGDGAGTPVTLAVDIEQNDAGATLSWAPVEGADQYEIRVFSEAGDPVFEQRSRDTSIDLPATRWQGSVPAGSFYVQVVALDELRQTLAESQFEPL